MNRRFLLYRFRYRDEVMAKWVTARYAAELAEIQARYREWEIFGTREVTKSNAWLPPPTFLAAFGN